LGKTALEIARGGGIEFAGNPTFVVVWEGGVWLFYAFDARGDIVCCAEGGDLPLTKRCNVSVMGDPEGLPGWHNEAMLVACCHFSLASLF